MGLQVRWIRTNSPVVRSPVDRKRTVASVALSNLDRTELLGLLFASVLQLSRNFFDLQLTEQNFFLQKLIQAQWCP